MHRLHKVTKVGAFAMALRRVPWAMLNFVVFAGLSLWIAFRRVSHVISRRVRPQPIYSRSSK